MSDFRIALEQALGPMYRVEREVRPVGPCRLFVALEVPVGPALLVKVLPAELSLALDAAQFERELVLLGDRLTHPQLVAPRGAGRAGVFVYHARPFIEGTTLRAWLARDGELPLRRAVEILHDVLGALAHVHASKGAHGDLKPENVLLAGSRALVADCGIVAAVARALPSGAQAAAGALLRTPGYVAPKDRPDVATIGPRDDMFAVGVLAHEMLTGRVPAAEAEPLEEVRSLPPWLTELVRRCLVPEPAGRWADAAAALAAVGRPSWGAA